MQRQILGDFLGENWVMCRVLDAPRWITAEQRVCTAISELDPRWNPGMCILRWLWGWAICHSRDQMLEHYRMQWQGWVQELSSDSYILFSYFWFLWFSILYDSLQDKDFSMFPVASAEQGDKWWFRMESRQKSSASFFFLVLFGRETKKQISGVKNNYILLEPQLNVLSQIPPGIIH